MLYNIVIFGKRYRNKTKEQIYKLLDKYADDINTRLDCGIYGVSFDVLHMTASVRRIAYFDVNEKVAISINSVKY